MKSLSLFLSILSLILFCGCNTWQEEPIETSMTFEELEEKMRQAFDPENRYGQLESYQQRQLVATEQLLDEPDEKFVTAKYLKPGYFSMTTYEDGGLTAPPVSGWIITPQGGWLVDYRKRKVDKIQPENLEILHRTVELNDFVTRIRQNSDKVELSACRVNGEENFYKLVCYPRAHKNDPIIYYIDQKTFLVRKMATSVDVRGIKISYETVINRYSLRDGIRMPEETVSDVSGITTKSRLMDYKLNPPFTPADFIPPVF